MRVQELGYNLELAIYFLVLMYNNSGLCDELFWNQSYFILNNSIKVNENDILYKRSENPRERENLEDIFFYKLRSSIPNTFINFSLPDLLHLHQPQLLKFELENVTQRVDGENVNGSSHVDITHQNILQQDLPQCGITPHYQFLEDYELTNYYPIHDCPLTHIIDFAVLDVGILLLCGGIHTTAEHAKTNLIFIPHRCIETYCENTKPQLDILKFPISNQDSSPDSEIKKVVGIQESEFEIYVILFETQGGPNSSRFLSYKLILPDPSQTENVIIEDYEIHFKENHPSDLPNDIITLKNDGQYLFALFKRDVKLYSFNFGHGYQEFDTLQDLSMESDYISGDFVIIDGERDKEHIALTDGTFIYMYNVFAMEGMQKIGGEESLLEGKITRISGYNRTIIALHNSTAVFMSEINVFEYSRNLEVIKTYTQVQGGRDEQAKGMYVEKERIYIQYSQPQTVILHHSLPAGISQGGIFQHQREQITHVRGIPPSPFRAINMKSRGGDMGNWEIYDLLAPPLISFSVDGVKYWREHHPVPALHCYIPSQEEEVYIQFMVLATSRADTTISHISRTFIIQKQVDPNLTHGSTLYFILLLIAIILFTIIWAVYLIYRHRKTIAMREEKHPRVDFPPTHV